MSGGGSLDGDTNRKTGADGGMLVKRSPAEGATGT